MHAPRNAPYRLASLGTTHHPWHVTLVWPPCNVSVAAWWCFRGDGVCLARWPSSTYGGYGPISFHALDKKPLFPSRFYRRLATLAMLQGASSGGLVIIVVVFETLHLLCPQFWTRNGGGGGDFNRTHTYAYYDDYYYLDRPSVNLSWLPCIVVLVLQTDSAAKAGIESKAR